MPVFFDGHEGLVRSSVRGRHTPRLAWMNVCVMAVMVGVMCAAAVHAQTPASPSTQAGDVAAPATSMPAGGSIDAATAKQNHLTVEQVQSHLQVLSADTSLDPAMRDQAAQIYGTAISRLQAAQVSQAAAENYRTAAEANQETIKALQAKRQALLDAGAAVARDAQTPATSPATPATTSPTTSPAEGQTETDLATIEAQLAAAHFEESALRGDLVEIQSGLSQLAQRPAEARREMIEAREKLLTLDRTQPEEAAGNQTILKQASRTLLAASRIYWPARLNELEQELVSLPKRRELLTAQRELVDAQINQIQRKASALAQVVDEKRATLAAIHTSQATSQAQSLGHRHPVLVDFANETAELSQQILQLTHDLTRVRLSHDKAQVQLQKVQSYEYSANQILEIGAEGEAYGQLLLTLRGKLPSVEKLKRTTAILQQAVIESKLSEQNLRSDEEALQDPKTLLKTLVNQQAIIVSDEVSLTPADRETFARLVKTRQGIIEILLQLQADNIAALKEAYSVEKQLLEVTQALALRLDERLIWLPSMPRIDSQWFKQIAQGVMWFGNPMSWWIAIKAMLSRALAEPIKTFVVAVLIGALIFQRGRMKRRILWVADQVGRVSTDSFVFTPQVVALTILMALPWALLLSYIGWLLDSDPNHQTFTVSVGRGFLVVGILLGLLRTFMLMCRPKGLFDAHFHWSDSSREVLGNNLRWLVMVECIAGFFVASTQTSGNDIYRSGVGRLAFVVGSIGLCYFIFRIAHPSRGVASGVLSRGGWLWRSRGIWFTMLVVPPLLLGVLAIMGYYQTASQIQGNLFTSAWVVLVGLILYSTSMRMVVVAHRRLAVRRAKEARQKATAAREANKEVQESGEAVPHMLDLPDVNLTSVSDQTRTLLRWLTAIGVGVILWMLWSELVPALSVLKDIQLWNGTIATEDGPQAMPITLLAVLTGMLTAAMTIVAAKNLPGLLEITAISRLALDSGTRYAIAAISRYLIIVVGLLIAFDQIGIQWSKMQWIVAALGVGLGFGLQEIVANFVSGMIILFERPVRVGDTVTVNDLSGTISRIQIRATTIVDWDNREILVPNKSFITEHVVNWTLSDPVTRLVMKVGIAYGSDTTLAHKLMMEVVKKNPMVLDNPAPTVFFLGFGDSSLDFEVRIFVSELTKRMLVMHELHMTINRVFEEHKIEIPFPQRDLHIRSSDVKWPVLDGGKPAEPTPADETEK